MLCYSVAGKFFYKDYGKSFFRAILGGRSHTFQRNRFLL